LFQSAWFKEGREVRLSSFFVWYGTGFVWSVVVV
jgi:hypothetical protein